MGWTYFLACIICVSSFEADQMPKYVHKGNWYIFNPDIPGQPSSISWKQNGNKVVEFNGTIQQVFGSYENRITLDRITAELEITDLRFEDSGTYELEAAINNFIHTIKYQLKVIDKVAKPIISCKINKGSSPDESEVQVTLLCSAVKPDSLLKFEWRSQGSSTPGDKITLSLKDQKDLEKYTCAVSNPLSSETATFTVKDCHHEEEESSLALIITLISALIGVVGTALGILFCKLKQKACFANDEEKQAPTEESDNRTSQMKPLLSEGKYENEKLPSAQPLRQTDSDNNEDSSDSDNKKQDDVNSLAHQSEQPETQIDGNKGPGMKPDEHMEAASPPSQCDGADTPKDPVVLVKAEEGDVSSQANQSEQPETKNDGNKGPGIRADEQKRAVLLFAPRGWAAPRKSPSFKFNRGDASSQANQIEQRDTKNEGNKEPGSTVVKQKASSKETSATTTDETSHWTDTFSDKPALTENEHIKSLRSQRRQQEPQPEVNETESNT